MSGSRSRPVLRYHGGKWRLAPWVIQHFPDHRTYVEPFGGAASVLMLKRRSYAEVYNDLDGEVVNVFRVLRDAGDARRLEELLRLTPFARDEFEVAYEDNGADPVERARRTLVKSFMGFGSNSIHDPRPKGMRTHTSRWHPPTAFRADSNRSGTTPAHDWQSYPGHLERFCDRLRGVVIENRPALQVMAQHDGPDTLHYVDPPYVAATRVGLTKKRQKGVQYAYRHEMSDADHRQLAAFLHQAQGYVVLSGYPCALYHELYGEWSRDKLKGGWPRWSQKSLADGARPRLEYLWVSPRTWEALRLEQPRLEL